MDREASVIRAEMTQTRAELDHKLRLLESRARSLPARYTTRYLPAYPVERLLGTVLTLAGLWLAIARFRTRRREARQRAAMAAEVC